jgi:hypothetical protein
LEAIKVRLAGLGLVPEARDAWVADNLPLRTFSGHAYLWTGSVTDKAAMVLSARGESMTASAITEAIAEGHDPRATRLRLLNDSRFMRVDRFRIALRTWGMEEYTGIVEEIAEEIQRRGGEANIRDVVGAVAASFAVSDASVTAFMGAPRFVVAEDRIRLRRPEEQYEIRQPLIDEAGCYLISNDMCVLRVDVDDNVLRGSGRRIPESLGGWLGVMPGQRRFYAFSDGEQLQISWPDSAPYGPTIGSLRSHAVKLGAREGDHLMIRFDRSATGVGASLVSIEQLSKSTPGQRLALLTGLDMTDGLLEERLARAVGGSSATALSERLRRRNEGSLIELLPHNEADSFDVALQRLRNVL